MKNGNQTINQNIVLLNPMAYVRTNIKSLFYGHLPTQRLNACSRFELRLETQLLRDLGTSNNIGI